MGVTVTCAEIDGDEVGSAPEGEGPPSRTTLCVGLADMLTVNDGVGLAVADVELARAKFAGNQPASKSSNAHSADDGFGANMLRLD